MSGMFRPQQKHRCSRRSRLVAQRYALRDSTAQRFSSTRKCADQHIYISYTSVAAYQRQQAGDRTVNTKRVMDLADRVIPLTIDMLRGIRRIT
jgi:hypothetical protein